MPKPAGSGMFAFNSSYKLPPTVFLKEPWYAVDVLSHISTKTLPDSVVTLYDPKSRMGAGNFESFPVVQSNSALCHPHVTVHPSSFSVPSDRDAPACVHVSSVA